MSTEAKKSTAPVVPKAVKYSAWTWLLGVLAVGVVSTGMLFSTIPVLGAIGGMILGFGLPGVLIGLMAAFLLPRMLFAVKGVGETVATAKSVIFTLLKAAVFAGAMFAFSYFVMPLIMTWLAGVTGVGLFAAFSGTSILSIVIMALSAAMTFFKTLAKGDFVPVLMANKARAVEIFLGIVAITTAALMFAGVIPTVFAGAAAIVLPIVSIFVGFVLSLGLPTTMREYFPSAPKFEGLEMGNLGSSGALPVPGNAGNAPRLSGTPAASNTAEVGASASASSAAQPASHPFAAAQQAAAQQAAGAASGAPAAAPPAPLG